MEWLILLEENKNFGTYVGNTIEHVKHMVREEHPAGSYTVALAQYRPAEDWVSGPYDVILSTLFAGYIVCTHTPNLVHQYRSEEWTDACECFIYWCKKRMEETELRCANCGKDSAWFVRDGEKLVCPMCFNGTKTIGQLIDKEMEK